jgi:hypothetical protein
MAKPWHAREMLIEVLKDRGHEADVYSFDALLFNGMKVPVQAVTSRLGVNINEFVAFNVVRLEKRFISFASDADIAKAADHVELWASMRLEYETLRAGGKHKDYTREERAVVEAETELIFERTLKRLVEALAAKGIKAQVKDSRLIVRGVYIDVVLNDRYVLGIWSPARRGKRNLHFKAASGVKARNFFEAASRKETDGFDIEKIAEYVDARSKEWIRLYGPEMVRRQRRAKWGVVAKTLREKHPEAAKRATTFEGCSKGIRAHFVLDRKEADAVLVLLETFAKQKEKAAKKAKPSPAPVA